MNMPIQTAIRAEAADADQVNAEADAADPHGEAGENHGKFHVACRTQAVAWNKGGSPYQGFYNGNPAVHKQTEGCALPGKSCQLCDRPSHQENEKAASKDHKLRRKAQLFNIVAGFVRSACPQALAYHRHHADSNADSSNSVKVFHNICHGLSGDGGGSKSRNGGLDCQLSKLEHAVFHAGRNTDPQDIFDKASVWFQEDEVYNPQFP